MNSQLYELRRARLLYCYICVVIISRVGRIGYLLQRILDRTRRTNDSTKLARVAAMLRNIHDRAHKTIRISMNILCTLRKQTKKEKKKKKNKRSKANGGVDRKWGWWSESTKKLGHIKL